MLDLLLCGSLTHIDDHRPRAHAPCPYLLCPWIIAFHEICCGSPAHSGTRRVKQMLNDNPFHNPLRLPCPALGAKNCHPYPCMLLNLRLGADSTPVSHPSM